MKTNQEIAASVFEKSKIVLHKRRQRRKRIAAAASTFGVIALITVVALGSRGVFDRSSIPTADPPSIPDASSAAVSESSRPFEQDSESTDTITSSQSKDTDSTETTSSEASSKTTSSKTTSSKTTSSKTTSSKTNSSISSSAASSKSTSSNVTSSKTTSSKTTSSKTTSSKTTSSKTTSSKTTSSKVTSSKTTSSKTTSSKVTSSKTTSSKTTSSKVTSSKVTSSKTTSSKTTSSKTTSSKTNSSKATSSKVTSSKTSSVTNTDSLPSTDTDAWYEDDSDMDAPHSGDSDGAGDDAGDETDAEWPDDPKADTDIETIDTEICTDGDVLAYYISPNEQLYSDAEQLVMDSRRIVMARVTDITYEGYSSEYSSITPVFDADDIPDFAHANIFTTYDIEIIDSLDGGNRSIGSFTVYGGSLYGDIYAQQSVTNWAAFPVIDGMENIFEGGTFVFLLDYNADAGVWTLHNYTQSAYNVYTPMNEFSGISANDVLSVCDELY